MKKEKILIIVIVLIIIIGAIFGFHYLAAKSTPLRKRMGIREGILEDLAKTGQVIEITSEGFREDFHEREITINEGEKVHFVNEDKEAHTLVREFGDQTASVELEPISTLSFPFMNFGQFTFYLEKWPEEKLKIIVE